MTFTDEPAVLTWMIALAPRPGPEPTGRHWWRELVTDAWRSAYQAWWLEREAVAVGYDTEMREFEADNPAPRLRDFMVHMSSGLWAPEVVAAPPHGSSGLGADRVPDRLPDRVPDEPTPGDGAVKAAENSPFSARNDTEEPAGTLVSSP